MATPGVVEEPDVIEHISPRVIPDRVDFPLEKQQLNEIIERLSDLYGAEVGDDDKLHFANGIVDRIERDEAVMAQVRSHPEDQMMHGLFPKRVIGAVLDAINDNEKLSLPVLENEETGRQFALLILKMLVGRENAANRA